MTDRLEVLQNLVATLRGPDGCPWDREQTLDDLRAYLLEEAHEVAAAIDGQDPRALAGELGDLLFQLVFIIHLAQEEGVFDLDEVIDRIAAKMVARHPHVFGDARLDDPHAVRRAWEERKISERGRSLLADLPATLPALLVTYRMTQKAAAVGFDWTSAAEVMTKVEEELSELRHELSLGPGSSRQRQREEVGDLLFTLGNLARHLEIDPDAALATANRKFRRRFQSVERRIAARGLRPTDLDREELERLWSEAKRESRATGSPEPER